MERINQHKNPIVGKNIRRLRTECGLRNRDVVAKLELLNVACSSAVLTKVEKGINNPSVDMLIALTQIFNCDFNDFFQI